MPRKMNIMIIGVIHFLSAFFVDLLPKTLRLDWKILKECVRSEKETFVMQAKAGDFY